MNRCDRLSHITGDVSIGAGWLAGGGKAATYPSAIKSNHSLALVLIWFEFLLDVALIKAVMQNETSQVKKNILSTFCTR